MGFPVGDQEVEVVCAIMLGGDRAPSGGGFGRHRGWRGSRRLSQHYTGEQGGQRRRQLKPHPLVLGRHHAASLKKGKRMLGVFQMPTRAIYPPWDRPLPAPVSTFRARTPAYSWKVGERRKRRVYPRGISRRTTG